MMRKSSSSLFSSRRVLWFGWKLVIALSVGLCLLALTRLRQYSQSEISSSSSSSPSDRVSYRSRMSPHFEGNSKIAFMFLARRDLPLDFLWGDFFQNADAANFSIYIHSEPGFVFHDATTRSVFFHNRQLTNSVKVGWGEASMIQAERLLLDAALEDPANQRFVLLSDSCVPLYNFTYVYSYLMSSSSRSFVDSFHDKKEGRYNPKMSNVIPRNKWRKGSQWFTLTRRHAQVVVDDDAIFPIFKKFCKRRPPVDPRKGKENIKLQKQHNCIPDEHYLPTLFAMGELELELERRTVTYTQWNESSSGMETKAWHPVTFGYGNAGPQQIKRIHDIKQIYYETELRTEQCSSSSKHVPCFLFARKFSRAAAMRLLSEGVTGPFDPTRLLASSQL